MQYRANATATLARVARALRRQQTRQFEGARRAETIIVSRREGTDQLGEEHRPFKRRELASGLSVRAAARRYSPLTPAVLVSRSKAARNSARRAR